MGFTLITGEVKLPTIKGVRDSTLAVDVCGGVIPKKAGSHVFGLFWFRSC
jgi:hypothetical protein